MRQEQDSAKQKAQFYEGALRELLLFRSKTSTALLQLQERFDKEVAEANSLEAQYEHDYSSVQSNYTEGRNTMLEFSRVSLPMHVCPNISIVESCCCRVPLTDARLTYAVNLSANDFLYHKKGKTKKKCDNRIASCSLLLALHCAACMSQLRMHDEHAQRLVQWPQTVSREVSC